jgi:RimJ/RimL family protein N-acetyltransferase
MNLRPVTEPATRDALLRGELGDLLAAPGWPHEDSAPGLRFLDFGGLVFLVIDDDGRIAGECGTKSPPDAEGMVEIGYGLAPASRGNSLGTRAVAALVETLQRRPGVLVVEAEAKDDNVPSWRILRRLGFRQQGATAHGFSRYRRDLQEPADSGH